MLKPEVKIMLSGGGTGGHIFPALAIANAIKTLIPQSEILFVGAEGRMEMEKVPAAGYRIEGLPISGFQRRLTTANFKLPFKIVWSLVKARRIIRKFKPDAVIGTGGYASGPTLRMASWLGFPTFIQEQNSYPGITNRALAKKARQIFVAYEGMENYFEKSKIILTGNPIRDEIAHLSLDRKNALDFFGLSSDKPVLLIIGGSLGARTINQSIESSLALLAENSIQIIWQTGTHFSSKAQEAVKAISGKGFFTAAFISRMDMAYAACDMIVSRAGAIAISELCAVGKPAVLVPSPNVAEDHQTKNAMALSTRKAALLIKDSEARISLPDTIIDLAKNKGLQKELSDNILKLAFRDAAHEIAAAVLKSVGKEQQDDKSDNSKKIS